MITQPLASHTLRSGKVTVSGSESRLVVEVYPSSDCALVVVKLIFTFSTPSRVCRATVEGCTPERASMADTVVDMLIAPDASTVLTPHTELNLSCLLVTSNCEGLI